MVLPGQSKDKGARRAAEGFGVSEASKTQYLALAGRFDLFRWQSVADFLRQSTAAKSTLCDRAWGHRLWIIDAGMAGLGMNDCWIVNCRIIGCEIL